MPASHGLSDIAPIYHDPSDLFQEAERIRRAFPELEIWIDVKNEARVHMCYASKFGYTIPPYASVLDAIDTFPTTATSVGLPPNGGSYDIYAPFGLSDLRNGVVRPNKTQITRQIYAAKVARWQRIWPSLTVVPWDTAVAHK